MVEFSPSEEKVAKIPMSNPTTKPFDYTVELYMGTNLALMASTDFHLEAGEEKDIELPVTMPSVIGTYPVYIGVFSAGEFIEPLYKAVEDVVIVEPIITEYALAVLEKPLSVRGGDLYPVTFQVDIPQSEEYVNGVLARFDVHTQLIGPSPTRGTRDAFHVGAGRSIVTEQLRSIDWWYGVALPPGTYELQVRMVKRWTVAIGDVTYSYSDLPIGDFHRVTDIVIT